MMFTKNQGNELINNTDSSWTTIDGVNGYKFFNKTNSSRYIFLQASGYWSDTTHYSVNSLGGYWSTTCSSPSHNWNMIIDSTNISFRDTLGHRSGFSIRPIAPPCPW